MATVSITALAFAVVLAGCGEGLNGPADPEEPEEEVVEEGGPGQNGTDPQHDEPREAEWAVVDDYAFEACYRFAVFMDEVDRGVLTQDELVEGARWIQEAAQQSEAQYEDADNPVFPHLGDQLESTRP